MNQEGEFVAGVNRYDLHRETLGQFIYKFLQLPNSKFFTATRAIRNKQHEQQEIRNKTKQQEVS